MTHLELLNQWQTQTYQSFAVNQSQAEVYGRISVKYGLSHHFLIHEILAMAALHLSLQTPERRSFWHQHSTQLQGQALAGFHLLRGQITEENVVPAFLFSALVGLHVFCETFAFRDDSFTNFLDSLTGCIKLLRGVRAVIGGWWDFLTTSELQPILLVAETINIEARGQTSSQLDQLRSLISTADLGPASIEAYEEAVQKLQWVLNVQLKLQDNPDMQSSNMLMSWPVTVPDAYTELLAQRRPEALVILAHYGSLLHCRRGFWAVGDAGRFLITSINDHLGSHWEHWLTWPNEVLAASTLN